MSGGTLFFSADDGTNGVELWTSDGTSGGTMLVKDINSGGNSNPLYLTEINGGLFFTATDGIDGTELWQSDGTSAGTLLVQNINPGGAASSPNQLRNINGSLFFTATDGVTGDELWQTSVEVSDPDLIAADDSGISNADNLTNVNTPTFTGTADPVATVELFDGNTLLGTATNNAGNWTFTVPSPLADGVHTITARAVDAGISKVSNPLLVTIDTSVTVSPPDLSPASDSGVSDSDNITNDTTPTFDVTFGPETNATFQLLEGSTLLGAVTASGTSASVTTSTLTEGTHAITARVIDRAGNTITSSPLSVTIKTSVPTVTINQAVNQTDPTLSTSVDFTAIFSEPVTDFDASDVQIGGTAGATTASVTPVNSTEYTITVSGFAQEGTVTASIVPGAGLGIAGNGSAASTSTDNSVEFRIFARRLAVGADAGGSPLVEVYDVDGNRLFGFFAYDQGFLGGVRVATGDVNGDLVEDIVTAAGPGGGPHVRIFDGRDGTLLTEFFAYGDGFAGGVFVAVGDLNNDGFADIITGAGASGGPHVRAFSGGGGGVLADFFAYDPNFLGGVTVAVGDVDGDGFGDIITGAGAGGSPHVRIFSGAGKGTLADFFAFDPAFQGGVFVASGDLNNDGFFDLIVGAGAGGGPHVRAFGAQGEGLLADFFAYDGGFSGGVRVASLDRGGDGSEDIVTGPGPGGGPNVRIYDASPFVEIDSFFAFDGVFGGGLFVG